MRMHEKKQIFAHIIFTMILVLSNEINIIILVSWFLFFFYLKREPFDLFRFLSLDHAIVHIHSSVWCSCNWIAQYKWVNNVANDRQTKHSASNRNNNRNKKSKTDFGVFTRDSLDRLIGAWLNHYWLDENQGKEFLLRI